MKIFSMSAYGTNPRYIVGAKRQVELAQKFLPNWEIRIYTDNPSNFDFSQSNIKILLGPTTIHGMFWRFLPVFESPDNITVLRDSDSRITIREFNAINEWISQDSRFHNIKDHHAHYEWPIMGGMWGYKGQLPNLFWEKCLLYAHNNNEYTKDQMWLRDVVWPYVENSQCLHDIKTNTWFAHTRSMLTNPFDFCGNGYNEHDLPLYAPNLELSQTAYTIAANKFSFGQLKNENTKLHI
jgi:protein O-GlcNAc transferase